MLVLNDLHLGVRRTAGTTAETSYNLRRHLQERYGDFLHLANQSNEVIINGDFFDTFNVPLEDVLEAFFTTAEWLQYGEKRHIYLLPGNHDLSKNSSEVGSFQLMAQLLAAHCPGQVTYLQGSGWLDEARGVYAVSHVINQAEFDEAIAGVPEQAKVVLLHCNYDSPFAEHSDHSLNLSRGQAKDIVGNGTTIIIAHEHHPRESFGGKVLITGNQTPSSIADCVTPDGKMHNKRAAVIDDAGVVSTVQTWQPIDDDGFTDVKWTEIANLQPELAQFKGFIRITGDAEPEESAGALRAVSQLRQQSKAFVVANAIKVRQSDGVGDLAASVEDVRSVNIVEMLLETLSDEQAAVVRRVLKEGK